MANKALADVAVTDSHIAKCFDVMHQLRPHLVREDFVATVRSMQQEGFKLAFLEHDKQVVAVAGYRIYSNLNMGRYCYVDDLVTATEHRSKGYGDQLLAWVRKRAIEAGCNVLHLDSGTHRGSAHRFYFSQGFTIASYHFTQSLEGELGQGG